MAGRKRKYPTDLPSDMWEGDSSFEIDVNDFFPNVQRPHTIPNTYPTISNSDERSNRGCKVLSCSGM